MTKAVKDIEKKDTALEKTEARAETRARFDVIVREKHVEILADMPGVDKEGVDITVHRNSLDITGRRPDYDGARRKDYKCSFTLGDQVGTDGITASVKNGVLKVLVPKAKDAGVKKIQIK
jgi:HSP20 family molecular chaperone IbpA